MKRFRLLKADEIDVRVSTVKESGVSLLLYKDSRVDMNILDETLGMENWQRRHTLIDGQLFCDIGIRVVREDGSADWIWKQDVGVESYTEKEKGRASDSFKRACFNLGIGRELYSAPFIWVGSKAKGGCANISPKGTGFTCFDRFYVTHIGYAEDETINALEIRCGRGRADDPVAYSLGRREDGFEDIKNKLIDAKKINALKMVLKEKDITEEYILGCCKVGSLNEITESKHLWIIANIDQLKEGYGKWKAKAG